MMPKLMEDYDYLERPVKNNSLPVVVKLAVDLQQMIGLDAKNQIFTVNVWLRYTWHDYNLQWDPDNYGGITSVRFPKGKIWMPDVLLYNSADSDFDATYPSNQIVYSDGTVEWIPPGILKSSCKGSFLNYFGSWTYNGLALDLQAENETVGIFMKEYLENGEWLIVSTPVNRSVVKYDCCPEPYIDLKFYINMKRRTLYYGINMIIPSLLISLMTCLGFTLPPDACEKITLNITVLLSLCVFLSMVANMTPATSEAVPHVGVFFSICLFLVSLSVVVTVAVQNFHFRTSTTNSISPFVRAVLLNWLPWLLMMKRPGHKFRRGSLAEYLGLSKPKKEEQEEDTRKDMEARMDSCIKPYLEKQNSMNPGLLGMLRSLDKIHSELKCFTQRMDEDDEEGTVENDWKFAAMVIDRVCLIVFTLVIVLSTGIVMFSAPYISASG